MPLGNEAVLDPSAGTITMATTSASAASPRKASISAGGSGTAEASIVIEPFANDDLADNLNPVGRVYYSASTAICTPASRAQASSSRRRDTFIETPSGY